MANKLLSRDIPTGSKILVDTNIWQYLYGIQASHADPGYSDVFAQLLTNNNILYVNPQIISEFINLNVRLAYKQDLKDRNIRSYDYAFKRDFEKSPKFELYYDSAIGTAKEDILKNAKLTCPNNEKVLYPLESHHLLDFNDEIILHDAVENHLAILTHDKDYGDYPGNINIYRLFWSKR